MSTGRDLSPYVTSTCEHHGETRFRLKSSRRTRFAFYLCVACHNEDQKRRYWANPETKRRRSLEYYYRNQETRKEANRKYYHKNKRACRRSVKEWRLRNPEKVIEYNAIHNTIHSLTKVLTKLEGKNEKES